MMKHIVFFMVLIFNNLAMYPQSNPQTVNFKELGLSFNIPSGWVSKIDGDYMFLKHPNITGLIVIFESRSKSVNHLITLANKEIKEEGTQLKSLNDFKEVAEHTVAGHYKGVFMATQVKAYAMAVINGYGSGVSVLAISEPKEFIELLKTEAKKIIESVKFDKIKLSKKTRFWIDRLVGKRLKYFNTQTNSDVNGGISGISDKEILDIFNDGSFYYHTNNQSIVSSKTLAAEENFSGDYRIVTFANSTYLQLFHKYDNLEFELSVSETNHTLLNGKRYFLEDLKD